MGLFFSNGKSEKTPGVIIDLKLNIDEHVSGISDEASQKLSNLARIFSFMKPDQKRQIMNAFKCSQIRLLPSRLSFSAAGACIAIKITPKKEHHE